MNVSTTDGFLFIKKRGDKYHRDKTIYKLIKKERQKDKHEYTKHRKLQTVQYRPQQKSGDISVVPEWLADCSTQRVAHLHKDTLISLIRFVAF